MGFWIADFAFARLDRKSQIAVTTPASQSLGHPSFRKEGSLSRDDGPLVDSPPILRGAAPASGDGVVSSRQDREVRAGNNWVVRGSHPPVFEPAPRVENKWPDHASVILPDTSAGELSKPRPKRRRFARRLATFAILLLIFAGGLYGTSAFLRSRGILPGVSNPFTAKTGRANTDINLRPEPNANNDPIGLVTKDSRVRIIKAQNNWYQVDVIEQGRQRDAQLATNRGWLNGKYVDLD